MNLSDLIAPDPGKVQPGKGAKPAQTEDESDTEFSSLVSDQTTEEPETQESLGAPQSAQSAAAPNAGGRTDTSASRGLGGQIAKTLGIAVPSETISVVSQVPAGDPSKPALTSIAPSNAEAPAVIPTEQRPVSGSAIAQTGTVAGQIASNAGLSTDGRAIPPATSGASTVPTPDTPETLVAAASVRPREAVKSSTDPLSAKLERTPASVAANGSVPKSGLPSAAPSAPIISDAQQASPLPAATQSVQPAQPNIVTPPSEPKAVKRAPQDLQVDEGRVSPTAEKQTLDLKVSERTIPPANTVSDIADAQRPIARAASTSPALAPVTFGVEPAFGSVSGPQGSQTTPSSPMVDPRIGVTDIRSAAQHVAPQIVSALAVRVPGTAIDVTLDPPELGRIEIMLDFAENGLRASLSAERQATGDLLRRHSEILSEHFENAGFSDVDLSFSNSSESGSDLFGSGTRTDDARQQSDQRPGSNAAESRRVQTSAGSAGMDILL